MLAGAVLLLLTGWPADCGRVEKNLGSAQRGQTRCLGVPLVPADQNADPSVACLPGRKAKVSRREIKLLMVERIVGNMHLAVLAEIASIGIEDGGGIVVDARSPALEQGNNYDQLKLSSQLAHKFRRGTGDFFGKSEVCMVLDLAEVRRLEKLLQANHLGAVRRGLLDARDCLFEIGFRLPRTRHLDQSHVNTHGGNYIKRS